MKTCCASMEDLINNYRRRGFSAHLPDDTSPAPEDWVPTIIFHSVDEGREDELTVEAPAGLEFWMGATMGITYCPWCGQRLITDKPA